MWTDHLRVESDIRPAQYGHMVVPFWLNAYFFFLPFNSHPYGGDNLTIPGCALSNIQGQWRNAQQMKVFSFRMVGGGVSVAGSVGCWHFNLLMHRQLDRHARLKPHRKLSMVTGKGCRAPKALLKEMIGGGVWKVRAIYAIAHTKTPYSRPNRKSLASKMGKGSPWSSRLAENYYTFYCGMLSSVVMVNRKDSSPIVIVS